MLSIIFRRLTGYFLIISNPNMKMCIFLYAFLLMFSNNAISLADGSKMDRYEIRVEEEYLQQIQNRIWNLKERLYKMPDDDNARQELERLLKQKEDIEREIKLKEIISRLRGYKIGIYFHKDRDDFRKVAKEIQNLLIQFGFSGDIQLYLKDDKFYKTVTPPGGYEIRYYPKTEFDAAEALKSFFARTYPSDEFRKVPVNTETSKFISIFLGPNN